MLDFMDYVQNAFYDASHWNRNNSYGALTATSQGKQLILASNWHSQILMLCSSSSRLPHTSWSLPPHLLPFNVPLRLLLHHCLHRPSLWLPLLPLHILTTPVSLLSNPLPPPPSFYTNKLPPAAAPAAPRPPLVVGDMARGQTD